MYSLERRDFYMLAMTAITLFGFISAQAVSSKDLFRCRQSCYQKFVQDWHHCMDFDGCKNMCITPPNINSYIPEAFSFLCWNNCDQQLGPFPLSINSAVRQGSLVITDIAWDQAITNASQQCLVTWEVSGGGLMGNLLTDSSTVELSLWSDTVYHVQVTCKHKDTGGMRRSYKLIVDTHKLGDFSATGVQNIPLNTPFSKTLPFLYGNDNALPTVTGSDETDSRMRILKDSSKDFLTPYNPNAIAENIYSSSSLKATKTTTTATTTTTNIAKTKQQSDDVKENEIISNNKVLSTKLIHHPSLAVPSVAEFFNATTLWLAIVGAMLLFCILIAVYVLVRPARKLVPVTICPIDHEVLIHNEVLPAVQLPAAAHIAATSTAETTAATTTTTAQQQHKTEQLRSTLHV